MLWGFLAFFLSRRACPALQLSHPLCRHVQKSSVSQLLCQKGMISIPECPPRGWGSREGSRVGTGWAQGGQGMLQQELCWGCLVGAAPAAAPLQGSASTPLMLMSRIFTSHLGGR